MGAPLLARRSTDEYVPLPPTPAEQRAAARLASWSSAALATRRGTAATLRAIDAEAGGGFYAVPAEAERDEEVAAATFGGRRPVVDVQTHLVRPSRLGSAGAKALLGFLRMVEPDRWTDPFDPDLLAAPAWASTVFAGSETALALLTSPPGLTGAGVIDNADIAAAKELVDRYAGTNRLLTHAIVHPNAGNDEVNEDELDRMVEWSSQLHPAGWKVYTLWDPPGAGSPAPGWYFDDHVGEAFLDRVEAIGPKLVCTHKGLAGPITMTTPPTASPRDIGPAARAHPGIQFVVYHSGYDLDPAGEEGAHDEDPNRGVSRLVSSLAAAGIRPGANVWAELGSTWFLMLRRPREAAHVLGKLLVAVGPERIVWGTDSVWYGDPQPLIDAFRAFRIPEWMQASYGYPALTPEMIDAILGGNAVELYGVEPTPRDPDELDWISACRAELATRLP